MTKLSQNIASKESGRETKRLTLNERLALINLMEGGMRRVASDAPITADLFENLSGLLNETVSGAKIDRLGADQSNNGFKILEINSDKGENLGRLNMLYLKKPIPCYYLVYVEVAAPFRNKGLGNLVLDVFRDFLAEKTAVGILDNIIPNNDPTYDIYLKLDWKPIEQITQTPSSPADGQYMIYVPSGLAERDLKDPVLKLIHHLKRKRPAIDMRDNELMVERTIEEFKDLYSALLAYFENEIRTGQDTSLMRFMFTRFVTKLLGFKRRIGRLLGYTGGESLEQILVSPQIRCLPVQSYAPRELTGTPFFECGDKKLWLNLPEVLKKHPARIIEALPNYRRPSLVSWMESGGISSADTLTIGDLLDLGFDPTRLKEINIHGEEFIFERVQPRLLIHIRNMNSMLERRAPEISGTAIRNSRLRYNPPVLIIRDSGNAYVLRRKLQGIHWEEAIEQLQGAPRLQALSRSMSLDRIVLATVRETQNWLLSKVAPGEEMLMDHFAYFVSWDLESNQPKIMVDGSGSYLETIWLA